MSSISKQALIVENNTNFPDNNTGYITPSKLREFNLDMIDSTVNQATYSVDIAAIQSEITALEAFTASQQPSFAALNTFTASQTITNSNLNSFTQSATQELDSLSAWTGSWEAWTSSINEIRDDGVLQGYSTRFFFNGLVSASIVQNVDGPIANVTILGQTGSVSSASFNDYTASNDAKWTALGNESGSFLITASFNNGTRELTFTKEDSTTFAVSIPDVSGSVTTGSNTFNGNQIVNGYVSASNGFISGPNTTALEIGEGSNVRFISGSSYYNVQLVPGVGDIAFSRDGANNVKVLTLAGADGNNTTFQNNPVLFNGSVSSLTVNAQSTAISGSGSYTLSAESITETATTATLTATSSVIGTFSVTGQNSGDGKAVMLGHSGSLVLSNTATTPTYSSLNHISSSQPNANTNLIFKNSTTAADTIVSGSANIFANPAAPAPGFKRYIGGSSNYYLLGTGVPTISGSMGFSPAMNGNIISNPNTSGVSMRGPVSSSAYTMNNNIVLGGLGVILGVSPVSSFEKAVSGLAMSGNALFNGQLQMVASTTPLSSSVQVNGNLVFGGSVSLNHISSSISYNSNVTNGSTTVNNRFLPVAGTSPAALNARSNTNTLYGTGHVINIDGTNVSTTIGKIFSFNILAGTFLTASVPTGDNSGVLATGMIGNGLIVTGSTLPSTFAGPDSANAGQGSLFAGRFNAQDGNKAKTAETIFAVGTGTSYTNRKTGFLIDSGSNTFVEGSLTITGSVYGNVSASVINSSTASIDLSVANYFTLTLSGSTNINVLNPRAGVTATLVITTDTAASASFSSNVKQPSGSLYVASPSGNVDIISFTAVDSNTVYAFPAQSFV